MPPPVRRKLLFACLSLVALALVVAGAAAAGNGGVAPPADTPQAQGIQDIYWVLIGVAGAIFVLVEGALLLFVIRFRSAGRPRDAEGPQIRGHTRLELLWTAIPVLILAGIIGFVFYKLPGIKDPPSAQAANSTRVLVEGHQFFWQFRYPNGAISIDRMVAPADEVVNEDITAPLYDVIHSWWVPDFGGKFDAIPGKVNRTWFQAPAGDYQARCYELCGIQHTAMLAMVHVVPRAQYDAFVTKRASAAGKLDLGQEEWQGACLKCHRLDSRYIGPQLRGNSLLANRAALEQLLRNGRGQMPKVGAGWSDAQIDALVAYTKQFAKGGS
jgi:cytochrome c oxidase subunit 2